jgi:hypothetical protein
MFYTPNQTMNPSVQPATSLAYRVTADGDRGSRHREVSAPPINRIIDERIKPDDL